MTIRAIRSEVCGHRDQPPSSHHGSEALVARRSWTTSTNAQAHMYDAVMLCGRGGCHPPRPSSSLQPLPRGSPRTTNGSPKAQLSTCIADANRARLDGNPPAQPEGKKWSLPKKNQSQPLGPWHPPQLRTARPIGPARSATRRSQPWAEPREWVTASRPRHGSRHLKHAPAKKTPLPLFFFLPPFPFGLIPVPQWPRPAATTGRCRSARDHLLAGCLVS